jgi:casein kinase 1
MFCYQEGVSGPLFENYRRIMVVDLPGPSLEDLFNKCSRRFSLKTTVKLGIKMLDLLVVLHGKFVMHRDIKPDNFLMGSDGMLYLMNFELARYFRNPETHQYCSLHENLKFCGTARYASVNCHKGFSQSRRDDLESLAYAIIYFYRGSLPWQGLTPPAGTQWTKEQRNQAIGEKKESTTSELCEGLPGEFAEFLSYCRSLGFVDEPRYDHLKSLLRAAYVNLGNRVEDLEDGVYDWMPLAPSPQQGQEVQSKSAAAAAQAGGGASAGVGLE